MDKQFNQCPNCGSEQRFCETLANELKEKGFAREEWTFSYETRQGAVVDKAKEADIPLGSDVPAFSITTDICLDCGTFYAIRLNSGTVTKQMPPPKLYKPGQGQFGNDPRFS